MNWKGVGPTPAGAVLTYLDTMSGVCSQTVVRVWSATFGDVSASCTQRMVRIDRTGPRLTPPPDATIECGDSLDPEEWGWATAVDDCSSHVTVTLVGDEEAPNTECPAVRTVTRTWSAIDGCGNRTEARQVVTIVDRTPPMFTTMPASVAVNRRGGPSEESHAGTSGSRACPGASLPTGIPPVPSVSAIDTCDPAVEIAFTETRMGDGPGVIVRSWVATDNCGNESELIQLVVLKNVCVRTPDEWQVRPEAWLSPFDPITEFHLGCSGDITTVAEALAILNTSDGDLTFGLAQELIAALLNIEQGADRTCIEETIGEVRDYFCIVPLGSNPRRMLANVARDLERRLRRFNQGRCCTPRCSESGSGASGE
ncbi:MAG: hypothetical protein AAF492_12610 [Verrucomicrobiota bacterium]